MHVTETVVALSVMVWSCAEAAAVSAVASAAPLMVAAAAAAPTSVRIILRIAFPSSGSRTAGYDILLAR
jgi:hypothetical protein